VEIIYDRSAILSRLPADAKPMCTRVLIDFTSSSKNEKSISNNNIPTSTPIPDRPHH
jgi:hypothetical protein